MNIKSLISVIFTPSCWDQIEPYSPEWDKKLNELMENNDFKNIDQYEATIGGFRIWIGNHPYGSFIPAFGVRSVRPKRSTILKAYEKLVKDSFKH